MSRIGYFLPEDGESVNDTKWIESFGTDSAALAELAAEDYYYLVRLEYEIDWPIQVAIVEFPNKIRGVFSVNCYTQVVPSFDVMEKAEADQ